MTDYVTKDGRHIALSDTTPSDPAAAFLRDLWREDVSEEVWAQWDGLGEIEITPNDHGYRGTLLFHRKLDDTYWGVDFVSENSGDYHSFRDGDEDRVCRLWPVTETITKYVRKDPSA